MGSRNGLSMDYVWSLVYDNVVFKNWGRMFYLIDSIERTDYTLGK